MSQVATGGAPVLESRWYEDEWQHCSEISYYLRAKALNFLMQNRREPNETVLAENAFYLIIEQKCIEVSARSC
jgi:hypothetical protein